MLEVANAWCSGAWLTLPASVLYLRKQLKLSTPNLVDIQCMVGTRHVLTLRSKGQRSRSRGYQKHYWHVSADQYDYVLFSSTVGRKSVALISTMFDVTTLIYNTCIWAAQISMLYNYPYRKLRKRMHEKCQRKMIYHVLKKIADHDVCNLFQFQQEQISTTVISAQFMNET